jgi:hypothetical protein
VKKCKFAEAISGIRIDQTTGLNSPVITIRYATVSYVKIFFT